MTQATIPQENFPGSNVVPFRADESILKKHSLQAEQTDLANAQHQIQQLQKQVLLLTQKLEQANSQTELALNLARHRSNPHSRRPKPSTIPTTYVVPTRSRAQRIDKWTNAVPIAVMSVLFGAGLTAAIATALPFSLWAGLPPLLMGLIRGLFVAIAFSTVVSFFLELWQSKLA